MKFLEEIEIEFKAQTEAIRSSYKKIVYAHFDAIGLKNTLDEYDWDDRVSKILEGSMGEASENDCKGEVVKTFTEFLLDEDKEKFSHSWAIDYAQKYLREELSIS